MATHIEAIIVDALCNHMAALTLPVGVGIAWPNVAFEPGNSPYVAVRILKNDPVQPRIRFGDEPIRQGIMQVTVYTPEGAGIIAQSELAGTIRDHFKRGTKITKDGVTVSIIDEPRVASDIQEPAWSAVPVSISWTVYP